MFPLAWQTSDQNVLIIELKPLAAGRRRGNKHKGEVYEM
jgi:hypothetical protein